MMTTTKRRSERMCLLIALLCLSAPACTVAHGGPQEGTETGNPPVIDVARVMLVVSEADAKITGGAGAVSPGGGQIEVQSSLTGKTYEATVAPNGSFEITVLGSPEDIFELRAADENGDASRASPVYVARGSAAISGGAQGLSCKQREDLARAQVNAVVQAANTYCKGDPDCQLKAYGTVCNDACFEAPVSTLGASQIEEARTAITNGICRDFSKDGCNFLALPCVPPPGGTLRCVSNACTLVPGS